MVKNLPANAEAAGDTGMIRGLGKSPGGGNGNTPVFLPGKSHGQRSLAGYSPWGCKELNATEHALYNSTILGYFYVSGTIYTLSHIILMISQPL